MIEMDKIVLSYCDKQEKLICKRLAVSGNIIDTRKRYLKAEIFSLEISANKYRTCVRVFYILSKYFSDLLGVAVS